MTDYKILGQEAPSADTETDLYTVPGDKSTVVRAINVTNTASASDTFDIANIEASLVETPTFVAVTAGTSSGTQSQVAAISTDGTTWTQTTMPTNAQWSDVFSNGNIFVAISGPVFQPSSFSYSFSTVSAYSTDGITWIQTTMPNNFSWTSGDYGNNIFVALGFFTTQAAISTNGITWTISTLPLEYTPNSIIYGNNSFVAVGGITGIGTNISLVSTDGITWNQGTLPVTDVWKSVTYGNNVFVAIVGQRFNVSQVAASSSDGITWTQGTLPASVTWNSIAYGNNTFVAIANFFGPSTTAATSTDGITWTASTMPSSQNWFSITYGNNNFVAVSLASQVAATSTDGITWTARTLPTNSNWQSIGYSNIQSVTYPSTSNADYIFKSHEILGNETITIKGGYTLDSNTKLKIKSTNGTSTFHAFGGEI